MKECFRVEHLDVERLLTEWRWLCPQQMALVARTTFGDLFLRDASGAVFRLDTSMGKLTQIAGSEAEFRQTATAEEKRAEWFAEQETQLCVERGLIPTP
jgi:hypothetical protein